MERDLMYSEDDIVQYGYEQPQTEWTDCYDWSPDDLDSDDLMD